MSLSIPSLPSVPCSASELRDNPSLFSTYVLGVEPHPAQAQWLDTRARVKVGCMGRRFGKSFSEAVDLIHFAVTHPGSKQFVIAPTSDQSRIIIDYMEGMVRASPILGPCIDRGISIVRSPFPLITIGGSAINARSAGDSGRNLRGHGADRIILDESAYIPESVIDVVQPMLAASGVGHLVAISTPFGKNHFWEMFTRGQSGETGYAALRFPTASNPHVSASYLEQQRREMTSLAYRVEYEAEFAEDQNAVFPWPLIESCIRPDLATGPQKYRQYVIGYDPAKWSDRSGVVVLDVTEPPWTAAHIDDISGRDYLTQAAEIASLHAAYHQAPVLLDATSHDQMLEQLRRDKVKASGFQFTNATKQELLNGLVIAMEQGRVLFPQHRDLIDELKYYRYELTASGNVKLGADDKHHDDLVTALALAVQHAGRRPVRVAPASLTKRSVWTQHSID